MKANAPFGAIRPLPTQLRDVNIRQLLQPLNHFPFICLLHSLVAYDHRFAKASAIDSNMLPFSACDTSALSACERLM